MKRILYLSLFLLINLLSITYSKAQIICIYCYDQNDSISDNVNNLMLNGGFENTNCTPNAWYSSSYCPNSAYYNCSITDWTCTGGGSNTYADVYNGTVWQVPQGNIAVYFGSYYCQPCSTNPNDTSCITMADCEATGIPAGYPTNDPGYGGSQGLSIEQTVNGLTPGMTYVLEFWTGGEPGFTLPGLFGVDIGFGYTYLRTNPTTVGAIGKRYIIEFFATSSSHTIKFTNWGHICSGCTELTLDDVRLYTIQELDPIVPVCAGATATAIFSAPNDICPGTCTNFNNLSIGATNFLWSFPGSSTPVSTDAEPQNICYNTPGNYDVTLIASNANSSDTLTLVNYITVFPWPAPQGISQSGDTLFANQGAVSYQWYENGTLIPGATDYNYVALESGNYNVVATDNNNCEVEAAIFDVIAGVDDAQLKSEGISIYPNPVKNKLVISGFNSAIDKSVSIFNSTGGKVMVISIADAKDKKLNVDVSSLPSGIYYVAVDGNGDPVSTPHSRFLKE